MSGVNTASARQQRLDALMNAAPRSSDAPLPQLPTPAVAQQTNQQAEKPEAAPAAAETEASDSVVVTPVRTQTVEERTLPPAKPLIQTPAPAQPRAPQIVPIKRAPSQATEQTPQNLQAPNPPAGQTTQSEQARRPPIAFGTPWKTNLASQPLDNKTPPPVAEPAANTDTPPTAAQAASAGTPPANAAEAAARATALLKRTHPSATPNAADPATALPAATPPAQAAGAPVAAAATAPASQTSAAPVAGEPKPAAPKPTVDPSAVVNPKAPRTLTNEDFASFIGIVHVGGLISDPQLRKAAGDSAMKTMESYKTGAASRLSSASRARLKKELGGSWRTFNGGGVSALTDPADREKVRNALIDERMGQLKTLGGSSGVVPTSRRGELFQWVDRFDDDGKADQLTLATPGDSATITPSGIATKRILENSSAPQSASETEFIKGFRNGYFNPKTFANPDTIIPNTPEKAKERADAIAARDALRNAGLLERFDALVQANPGAKEIHLNVPQLRALFRAIDAVDNDGSASTFITRNGGNIRNGTLPFNISNDGDRPTRAGTMVAALKTVFEPDKKSDLGDSPYDVPPPNAQDVGDPLQENRARLSDRQSIDRDAFADYMRDARIDVGRIYDVQPGQEKLTPQQQSDIKTLEAAHITKETLLAIAAPNRTIGGPNAEMARLYAMLHGLQGGPISKPLVLNNGFNAPDAGRALGVLERYTTRYDLISNDTLKDQLSNGMRFRPDVLDHEAPPYPSPIIDNIPFVRDMSRLPIVRDVSRIMGSKQPTVRERLEELGFNVTEFEAAMVRRMGADHSKWDANITAAELYARLKNFGGYDEARPGTLALASINESTGARSPKRAGEIWDVIHNSGYLATTEQQRKSYFNAGFAMKAPNGTTSVSLPYTYHGMHSRQDCLTQVSNMTASGGGGRRIIRNTVGSWMAKSNDSLGRLSADVSDLTAGRKYIDYSLEHGWKIGVGVTRLGGRKDANIDHMTNHYVMIYGRGVDKDGRLYYEYADPAPAPSGVEPKGRFYVDQNTNLLYAPVDSTWTVGHGGYQVTHIRAFANGDFRQEFAAVTGQDPRGATPYNEPRATQVAHRKAPPHRVAQRQVAQRKRG